MIRDSQLERIEDQVRRDFPELPDAAVFVAAQTEPGFGEKDGIQFPIPEGVMLAILVPTRGGYQRIGRWFRAAELAAWEKTQGRIVGAPDIVLDTFRNVAWDAVQVSRNVKELMN